jgi:hypothetical protein
VLEIALLHDAARRSNREIANRLDLSTASVVRALQTHRHAMESDDAYSQLAARVLKELLGPAGRPRTPRVNNWFDK